MKVSIIIPTHNRPELLKAAIQSVGAQSFKSWEIIIVDDGSEPAVDPDQFKDAIDGALDGSIRLVRNIAPEGIAHVREQGAALATGDLVWQLDDDDLLEKDALKICTNIFVDHPGLEVLFVNVAGFGTEALQHGQRQKRALNKLLALLNEATKMGALAFFDQRLFDALLTTVPQALQHPIVTPSALEKVRGLQLESREVSSNLLANAGEYFLARDYLSECEWAIFASLVCSCALTFQPLYRVRCEGQGYFSDSPSLYDHALAQARFKRNMFLSSNTVRQLQGKRHCLKHAYSRACFDVAYQLRELDKRSALKQLLVSIRIDPSWEAIKLCLKILITPSLLLKATVIAGPEQTKD